MTRPIIIGPKFDCVIWLLLKAWGVGIFVASVLIGIIFTMGIDMSLETSTALKVVVTFIMGTLFLLLSATIFTLPLLVIAGLLAYALHNHIWQHPRITTLIAPIVGLVIFQAATHVFSPPTYGGLIDALSKGVISTEGIATLIALTASTAYYSFTLRAKILGLKDGKSS